MLELEEKARLPRVWGQKGVLTQREQHETRRENVELHGVFRKHIFLNNLGIWGILRVFEVFFFKVPDL